VPTPGGYLAGPVAAGTPLPQWELPRIRKLLWEARLAPTRAHFFTPAPMLSLPPTPTGA
jgi:hypothetical protein